MNEQPIKFTPDGFIKLLRKKTEEGALDWSMISVNGEYAHSCTFDNCYEIWVVHAKKQYVVAHWIDHNDGGKREPMFDTQDHPAFEFAHVEDLAERVKEVVKDGENEDTSLSELMYSLSDQYGEE